VTRAGIAMKTNARGLRKRTRLLAVSVTTLYLLVTSSINLFHVCSGSIGGVQSTSHRHPCCTAEHCAEHAGTPPREDARLIVTPLTGSPLVHRPCPACLFIMGNQAPKLPAPIRACRASPHRIRVPVIESVLPEERSVPSAMPRAPPRHRFRPV
jgi:hypothetical protein